MCLKVGTKNRTLPCLLDTGCDRCVMPRKYVRRQKLAPAEKSVFAANGSEIAILGSATLKFSVGGQELSADFLVTDGIDEIILGFSFLRRYKCHWLFDEAVFVINGSKCALKNRPGRATVRRIYVRQSVSVPAGSSVNVPVKLPVPNLNSVSSDWLSEAVELRPGLLLARTLLPDCDQYAAVPVVNVSGRDQFLEGDLCLGQAVPGECLNDCVPAIPRASSGDVLAANSNVSPSTPGRDLQAADESVQGPCDLNSLDAAAVVVRAGEEGGALLAVSAKCEAQVANSAPACGCEMTSDSSLQCAAVDCQPQIGAVVDDVDNVSQVDFSDKSDTDLYAMFQGEFAHVKPVFDSLPTALGEGERRKVAN